MTATQQTLYAENANFRSGYDLGRKESESGQETYRAFAADESPDFINGYAVGFASHCWDAYAELCDLAEAMFSGEDCDSDCDPDYDSDYDLDEYQVNRVRRMVDPWPAS
jgi:hypothetical protein